MVDNKKGLALVGRLAIAFISKSVAPSYSFDLHVNGPSVACGVVCATLQLPRNSRGMMGFHLKWVETQQHPPVTILPVDLCIFGLHLTVHLLQTHDHAGGE